MKKFFRKVINSIWGPDFYSNVNNEKVWGGIVYLIGMVAIVSVVGAIITFSFVAPKSKQLVFQLADYLNNKYPKNLEISILDGVLSTNTAEVHNLEFPEEVFGSDVINQIKNDAKVSYLFSVDGNEENF
jgi:hypothetical protein